MIIQGGKIHTEPSPEGLRVTVTGPRIARRLDAFQVFLICGWCHEDVLIVRADHEPMRESDIPEALAAWVHECGRPQ